MKRLEGNTQILELRDNTVNIIKKMGKGNPGAMSVLIKLLQSKDVVTRKNTTTDYILDMDRLGIYGENIWILYKDLCSERLNVLMAILYAQRTGNLDTTQLLTHIEGIQKYKDHTPIDVDAVIDEICDENPLFVVDEEEDLYRNEVNNRW